MLKFQQIIFRPREDLTSTQDRHRHQTSCSRISCSQEYDVFVLCLAFAPNDQSYVLDDSDVNSDSTIPPTRIEAFELLAEDDVRVLMRTLDQLPVASIPYPRTY